MQTTMEKLGNCFSFCLNFFLNFKASARKSTACIESPTSIQLAVRLPNGKRVETNALSTDTISKIVSRIISKQGSEMVSQWAVSTLQCLLPCLSNGPIASGAIRRPLIDSEWEARWQQLDIPNHSLLILQTKR